MSVRVIFGGVAALLVPPAAYRMTMTALVLAGASWVNSAALKGTVSDFAAALVTVIACGIGIRQALDSYQAGKARDRLAAERDRLAAERAERKALDDERHEKLLRELEEVRARSEVNAALIAEGARANATSATQAVDAARIVTRQGLAFAGLLAAASSTPTDPSAAPR
jgi:hypothetical protein